MRACKCQVCSLLISFLAAFEAGLAFGCIGSHQGGEVFPHGLH